MNMSEMRTTPSKLFISGFTLLEMVVTIVLIGIVGVMATGFLRFPMQSFVDTSRRTELSTAIARVQTTIDRDVARTLPGSIRVFGTSVEMVPIVQSTRYCSFGSLYTASETLPVSGATITTVPCNDPLEVTQTEDGSFQALGPEVSPPKDTAAQLLSIVVGNNGAMGSDVYAGANRRAVTGVNANIVSFTATADPIKAESPSETVHFVIQPVSYACSIPTGELLLFRNYPFTPAPATQVAQPVGGDTPAVLATGLTDCTMKLTEVGFANVVLTIRLTFKLDGGNQQVVLQSQVNNSP